MFRFIDKYSSTLLHGLIILFLCASLWQLLTAGWIQGKALLAQQLLNHAWNKSLREQSEASRRSEINKPWPWADTWPVAKLRVPQHGIEQIILAGDSGNSLAFAPGYSFASAKPNATGTTMISAHRDTHFGFLKQLKRNDTIFIQSLDQTIRYQVVTMKIVDNNLINIITPPTQNGLLLVTCYPFDAILPGGSLRYLVYAKRLNKVTNKTSMTSVKL